MDYNVLLVLAYVFLHLERVLTMLVPIAELVGQTLRNDLADYVTFTHEL